MLFGPSRDLGKALPVASFPADGRLCPSIVSDPRPRDTRRLSQLCQGSSPSNSGDFLDGPVSLPSTRGLRVSPEPERPGSEPSPAPLLPVGAPPLLTSACPALSPRPCRAGCLGKGHHLSRCPSRGGNRLTAVIPRTLPVGVPGLPRQSTASWEAPSRRGSSWDRSGGVGRAGSSRLCGDLARAPLPAPGSSSNVAASPHVCLHPYVDFFSLSLHVCFSLYEDTSHWMRDPP